VVHNLLFVLHRIGGTMFRISLGLAVLAALLVTYWVNPTAAWVALFTTSTLALARHVRQRDDEAEAALQRVEE
jgi:di/tricarboxylate transporter